MVLLPLTLGTTPLRKTCLLKFLVVDIPSTYIILGRPTLDTFRAIISTYHMKIKFPMIGGVGEAQANALQARKCYIEAIKKGKKRGTKNLLKPRTPINEKNDPIPIPSQTKRTLSRSNRGGTPYHRACLGDLGKVTKIGSKMTENVRNQIINCLRKNKHIFAWTPQDLEGIDPGVITHHLNLDPSAKVWRAFPRIHGNPTSYRGQPSQDQSYPGHGTPNQHQRSATADRMMAALSRFISKSIEKGLPFFKILRKVKDFEWTEECQQAFEYLKAYLAKPPLLVTPMPGDTLYLYLSSTPQAISSVLEREEDGGQIPIYYINKVLNGAECHYLPIERLALAWSP
ncbi:hypothetical protein Sango_3074000 [Sesamum angolense]|uniref:Reverse transcriptase/retrotransposon-derived protein RNase H-like domain-containing protein n=1 Tax=Sesamum angolense TaxID=2727404 RepID=A0AAE1TB84_9LAMI|nr:hypothetical protein Sango_3074000 [Sesamum angolense]